MAVSIPSDGSWVYVPPKPYWPTTNDNIKYTMRVRLNWQSIPENRSSIRAEIIAWRTNTGYTTYGSGTAYFQNGAGQSWDSQSISPSQTITYNSDTVLFSRDVFVYHDANGNATTQLGAYFNISGIVSAEDNYESISLPQIPRNALLDSVTGATKFGDTATLSMSRILAGRYYKLEVLHGSTVIDTTNFVSTSVPPSKEMDVDWQEYNKTSQSTTLTLRVTTYSDSARTVQVGSSSSKNITLSPSADAKPTFTFDNIVHNGTLSTPNVPNSWNTFVQNKSGAVATISSLSAKYGASITSVVITGNGESASGTSGNTTLTTGPLATAGTMTFTAVVTDSRGLTATAHKSITVAAYKAPVIHTMLSRRSDISGTAISDGTYMLAKCDYSFSAVGSNSAHCEVWTRPSNTEGAVFLQVGYRLGGTWVPGTGIGVGDDGETLTRNSATGNSFLTDQSYDVRYIVSDALSSSYKDDVLSISKPAMEFSMAGEVGIGCEPVAGKALAVGGDTAIDGELTLGTPLAVTEGGTGATTAAGVRSALGLGAAALLGSIIPVANGGTGTTSAASARNNLGLYADNVIIRGNTGGATVPANGAYQFLIDLPTPYLSSNSFGCFDDNFFWGVCVLKPGWYQVTVSTRLNATSGSVGVRAAVWREGLGVYEGFGPALAHAANSNGLNLLITTCMLYVTNANSSIRLQVMSTAGCSIIAGGDQLPYNHIVARPIRID